MRSLAPVLGPSNSRNTSQNSLKSPANSSLVRLGLESSSAPRGQRGVPELTKCFSGISFEHLGVWYASTQEHRALRWASLHSLLNLRCALSEHTSIILTGDLHAEKSKTISEKQVWRPRTPRAHSWWCGQASRSDHLLSVLLKAITHGGTRAAGPGLCRPCAPS